MSIAEDITRPEHSERGASGAHRWMVCAGSVRMSRGLENKSGDPANQGTAAHNLLEKCIKAIREPGNSTDPVSYLGELIFTDEDGKEWFVDKEMADHIADVIEYISEYVPLEDCYAENDLEWLWLYDDGYGRGDVMCLWKDTLYGFDLKYGRYKTDAVEQLRLYGLGGIDAFEMFGDIKTVSLHVCQPRLKHYTQEILEVDDLLAWGTDVVKPAALATEDDDAPLTPGEKQCHFCLAKESCKPRTEFMQNLAGLDFEDLDDVPAGSSLMDEDEFADALAHIPALLDWCKDMYARANRDLTNGIDLRDHKHVYGTANRRYIDKKKAENFLRRKCGFKKKDVYTPGTLLSLTAVEKILDKEQKVTFQDFLEKPKGSAVLALKTDKRDAIVYAKVEEEFDILDDDILDDDDEEDLF